MATANIAAHRHTRRTPDEWPALVEQAQAHIDRTKTKAHPLRRKAAGMALADTMKLSDKALEANRYYGLGLMTCALMQSLATPEGRNLVIHQAAQSLIIQNRSTKTARSDHRRGLRISDLAAQPTRSTAIALRPIVQKRVSPAQSLVTDSLVVTEYVRRKNLAKGKTFDPTAGHALQQVDDNLFSAAFRLHAQALTFKAAQDTLAGKRFGSDPMVRDILGKSLTFASFNLRRTAMYAAKLRLDEFIGSISQGPSRLIRLDETGATNFDTAYLKQPAPPRSSDVIIHDERLACPAAYVTGAIPTIMDMVPEIVAQADYELAHPIRARLPSW